MILVVLGMHKSGTTMVSELLHKSGINMVEIFDEKTDYYAGNKVERASTLEMNHEILQSKSVFSLDIPTVPLTQLSDVHKQKMLQIVSSCNQNHEAWGFKDPRTCSTYPLWAKILPTHKIIFVYRHPFHVLNHYTGRVGILEKWSRANKAYRAWTENNRNLVEYIKSATVPYIVLNYQDLLQQDEIFNQLSLFIDRPLKDSRIKKKRKANLDPSLLFKLVNWLNGRKAIKVLNELETLKVAAK